MIPLTKTFRAVIEEKWHLTENCWCCPSLWLTTVCGEKMGQSFYIICTAACLDSPAMTFLTSNPQIVTDCVCSSLKHWCQQLATDSLFQYENVTEIMGYFLLLQNTHDLVLLLGKVWQTEKCSDGKFVSLPITVTDKSKSLQNQVCKSNIAWRTLVSHNQYKTTLSAHLLSCHWTYSHKLLVYCLLTFCSF